MKLEDLEILSNLGELPPAGDLKSEDSVLEWLTDDDNRELEDEIEAVMSSSWS